MAPITEQTLNLAMRSCRYTLPDDLAFETLVVSANGGPVKIRFARSHGTTLDLPLSAETLADLIQTLGHMFGTVPEDLPQVLQEYRQMGGPVIEG